ncbi:MAG: DNA primase, partial [Candidatus Sungbacteria bacterium]|nr:DNA primase [Candidatus Sungbacteria bacterium]
HCFGCGKGGDIFQFVMEMEGHDFPEALKMLASRAGIEIKREDPRIRSERNLLYDISEEAARIFEKNLAVTQAAKTYISKRGLTAETVAKFRVGFAPQSWDFLLKALTAKGFKKEHIEQAGLVIRSQDKSSVYDRFRSRIMFPITDANERVIGFGGRIFEMSSNSATERMKPSSAQATDGQAKYINTPQTMIYDKSSVLYGFDKGKQEIRVHNSVVLVEGYMDCVMSHQAGVINTVAVSGTALTPQQLKTLRRLCDSMICSFDTDAAGESATRRSLALASEFDFERRVAHIHTGKDPADAVLENPELWREAVAHAKPVVEFYIEKAFREHDQKTAAGKKAISDMVLPFIADLFDAILRDHWAKELARRLGVNEESIFNELARRGGSAISSVQQRTYEKDTGTTQELQGRRERLEEKFLMLLAMIPEGMRVQACNNHSLVFRSGTNQNIFAMIMAPKESAVQPLETAMQDMAMFTFKSEILSSDVSDIKDEFLLCKRELEKECVKEKLRELEQDIQQKESNGSFADVANLLQDFRKLSETLKQLSIA